MDGKIIIGTEIDQSGVEDGLKETKDIITKDDLKVMIEEYVDDEGIREKFDELNELIAEYKATSKLPIQVEGITDEVMADTRARIEELRSELQDFFGKDVKIPALDDAPTKLDDIKKKLEGLGTQFSKIGKKVVKWSLSLFGIRTLFSLITKTTNQLAQENDEINAKVNTIRNSLTRLLAPLTEVLINLAFRLLSYLNVITKKFFNIDLFAKSKKSAKELQKTMAGFDEMNVLSNNGNKKEETIEPVDTGNFANIVSEFKKNFDELLNINRDDMATMLLDQDKTWGLMKLGWFDTIQGIARILEGIVDIFKGVFDIIVGLATGDEEKIKEGARTLVFGIIEILQGLLQAIVGILEMIGGVIWGALKTAVEWVYNELIKPVIDFFKNLWDSFKTKAKESWEGVKKIFSKVASFFKDTFKKAWDGVKALFSKGGQIFNGLKDGIVNAFKTVVNAIISGINTAIAIPFKAINGLLNKIHDVNILGLKPFEGFWGRDPLPIPELPKLARGGIINMPSRGVPIALGGERGAEGVIPLTDSQQMELLGEAIGKYITINANITNTMNGRVISRELQKIQNQSNFASNR